MEDTPWDHGLRVTAEDGGLVGHAGAVLLRKLADRAGLTAALGSALARAGKFPLVDRGVALVSMAVAIALGATSMTDITLLAHQEQVFGAAPSDTTVRRTLELADPATLDKIARVRAAVRAHVWSLIAARPAGFPWLAIAGKILTGWLVIDLDGTLVTARSDKEGAAPTFKMGYDLPPAGGVAGQYRRVAGDAAAAGQRRLEHLHRSPRRADRGDAADPRAHAVEAAGPRRRGQRQPRADHPPAVAVLPAPHRAVHQRLGHHRGREQAIGLLPAAAWQAAVDQDGVVQEDKHVAEITHLLSRAAGWPAGLRWIVRRTRPSRRQARNLTAFERATGWRYSIIVTNIPAARGIPRRARQPPRPVHRRAAPPARCRRGRRAHREVDGPAEPSSTKTWVVNCGWVLAANLAADLAAWCRLLGLYDCDDLKDAEPDTLRPVDRTSGVSSLVRGTGRLRRF